jgi:hypothetical protein
MKIAQLFRVNFIYDVMKLILVIQFSLCWGSVCVSGEMDGLVYIYSRTIN